MKINIAVDSYVMQPFMVNDLVKYLQGKAFTFYVVPHIKVNNILMASACKMHL